MSKPVLLAMSVLLLACGIIPSQMDAQTSDKTAPRIEFSERSFDFGKVGTAAKVRHDFIVTNSGNAVLEITSVQPSCGCTTAAEWDRKILPGKTGRIPVQFDPANFNGLVTKFVSVTCNDPTQATHSLQLQATVLLPFEVRPNYAYFLQTEGEETNETKIVRIISRLNEPVSFQKPECENSVFTGEVKTIKAGKEFELHITYTPSPTNPKPRSPVSVRTAGTNNHVVKITTLAMPQPPIQAVPGQIQLRPGPSVPAYTDLVTIRNNSRNAVKLLEASLNAEGVKVNVNEVEAGKVFALNIDFPANFQLRGDPPMELTVKTSHPTKPVITVPLVPFVAPVPIANPKASATAAPSPRPSPPVGEREKSDPNASVGPVGSK
jgi:hypothetical protein